MTAEELKAQVAELKAQREARVAEGKLAVINGVERDLPVEDAGKWETAFLAAFPTSIPNRGAMLKNTAVLWAYKGTTPKVSGTFYDNGTFFVAGATVEAVEAHMVTKVEPAAKRTRKPKAVAVPPAAPEAPATA